MECDCNKLLREVCDICQSVDINNGPQDKKENDCFEYCCCAKKGERHCPVHQDFRNIPKFKKMDWPDAKPSKPADLGAASVSMAFDENKSQGAMPRLYEHIDRVDLWIMAQSQQHSKDKAHLEISNQWIKTKDLQISNLAAEIEKLRADNEELKAQVDNWKYNFDIISKAYIGSSEA